MFTKPLSRVSAKEKDDITLECEANKIKWKITGKDIDFTWKKGDGRFDNLLLKIILLYSGDTFKSGVSCGEWSKLSQYTLETLPKQVSNIISPDTQIHDFQEERI